MKVLVIVPEHSADLLHKESGVDVRVVEAKTILNSVTCKGARVDVIILSESLQEPDRNLCLRWAIELFAGEGKTKEYIKSHIIFA